MLLVFHALHTLNFIMFRVWIVDRGKTRTSCWAMRSWFHTNNYWYPKTKPKKASDLIMCFCFYSQTTSRIFKWCIGLVSHKDFHGNWQRNPVFTAHLRLPLTTRKNLFHDWLLRIHACILLSPLFSGFQLIPSSESRPRNFIVIVHSEVAYQPRQTNQLLLLDSPTRSLGADLHEHQLIFLSW